MVEVKEIIKKMAEQGMTREQIADNLAEMGFADVQNAIDAALPAVQNKETPAFSITSIGAQGDEKELKFDSDAGGAPLFSEPANSAGIEAKLDDALALLKSIQDLNRKLLKANQDLAAKIK
jgi:hypothetical protein